MKTAYAERPLGETNIPIAERLTPKDTSYLKGRVMMIPVIEELARNNDKQSFRNMLSTKTDPTDPEQREFAARHGYPVMVSLGK